MQDPAAPAPPGSLVSDELVQVLDAHGHIVDASGPGTASPLLTQEQLRDLAHRPVLTEFAIPRTPHRFLLYATSAGDGVPGAIVVGASLATVDEAIARVTLELVVGSTVGVLVAGGTAWLLAGAALRPVERMRRQAAEISEHDIDMVLAVPETRDEIASLAITFNTLLARLHGALSRQRAFVSAAGHELRSPLAILKGELELAMRPGRSRVELADAISRAAMETERVIHLAEDLLMLSRIDEHALVLRRERVNIRHLVEASASLFRTRASQRGVAIAIDGPENLWAEVDPDRVRQIIDNVVDNALRFSPQGSTVNVQFRLQGPVAEITVSDQGPGFPPEFLPRAFERFSRPDASRSREGGGTGLGLAIVDSLTRMHGGSVTASNQSRGGAAVRISLPIGSPPPASERG